MHVLLTWHMDLEHLYLVPKLCSKNIHFCFLNQANFIMINSSFFLFMLLFNNETSTEVDGYLNFIIYLFIGFGKNKVKYT